MMSSKPADYRISPFEVESALIEHADVVECAVVPTLTRCGTRW
jgi:acyl-coenzyme A synthetase/AMP-(fatty) acid ligase